jgi:hypothetical protein
MSDNPHSLSERRHPYLPGLWLAAGFLGLASLAFLLRPAGVTPDTITEKAAMERWDKLQKLKAEQAKDASSYGWIDKEKGIARIPVEKAMEIVTPRLRAQDPKPAYPITTIAPSAITAAAFPLYPEVPVDSGAMAAAQAADGGPAISAPPAASVARPKTTAATSTNQVKK